MNDWGTHREVEKLKKQVTKTARRLEVVAQGEQAYVKTVRRAEAARTLFGDHRDAGSLCRHLYEAAHAIRALIDVHASPVRKRD